MLVYHLTLAFRFDDNYGIIVIQNQSSVLKTIHDVNGHWDLLTDDFIQYFVFQYGNTLHNDPSFSLLE